MDGDKLVNGIIGVMIAIVGLATTAVIFSKNGQTAPVLTAGGNAFAAVIKAAVGPVSGGI
jgi:hypothetical protein